MIAELRRRVAARLAELAEPERLSADVRSPGVATSARPLAPNAGRAKELGNCDSRRVLEERNELPRPWRQPCLI